MTAQDGVRQDFLHVRAYNIMHTLTYTSDFNFVTPCSSYNQVGSNSRMSQYQVKFTHPVFHLRGRVMLNKL